MLKFNPHCDGIQRWPIWDLIRSEGGNPREWEECPCYKRDFRELACPLCHERFSCEDSNTDEGYTPFQLEINLILIFALSCSSHLHFVPLQTSQKRPLPYSQCCIFTTIKTIHPLRVCIFFSQDLVPSDSTNWALTLNIHSCDQLHLSLRKIISTSLKSLPGAGGGGQTPALNATCYHSVEQRLYFPVQGEFE